MTNSPVASDNDCCPSSATSLWGNPGCLSPKGPRPASVDSQNGNCTVAPSDTSLQEFSAQDHDYDPQNPPLRGLDSFLLLSSVPTHPVISYKNHTVFPMEAGAAPGNKQTAPPGGASQNPPTNIPASPSQTSTSVAQDDSSGDGSPRKRRAAADKALEKLQTSAPPSPAKTPSRSNSFVIAEDARQLAVEQIRTKTLDNEKALADIKKDLARLKATADGAKELSPKWATIVTGLQARVSRLESGQDTLDGRVDSLATKAADAHSRIDAVHAEVADLRDARDTAIATADKDYGEFISYRTYSEDQLLAGYRRDEQLRELVGELRSDVSSLRRGEVPPARPTFLPGPPRGFSPPPRRGRDEDDEELVAPASKRSRARSPPRTGTDEMDVEVMPPPPARNAPTPQAADRPPAARAPSPALPTPRADLTYAAADGDPGDDSCVTCIIGKPTPSATPFAWARDGDNLKAVQDLCARISPLCPPPILSFDRKGTVAAVFRYFKFVDRARFLSFMSYWRARPAAYKNLVAIAVADADDADPMPSADPTPSLGALLREHTAQPRATGGSRAGDRRAGERRQYQRSRQNQS
ncbi:hypothetical protein EXIGLDRAFT_701023 [Exidia glandulosa HHB12029]|uniref:Uncharacterized protein n=1 Tax=Exidia glandulosa HHB12029 TaxID=1314781 RepID=A0A165D688_EXIGL|nr:hypothetical protein EXIGLDRAFT_701023 [Exidia glandulosa HHB12029]